MGITSIKHVERLFDAWPCDKDGVLGVMVLILIASELSVKWYFQQPHKTIYSAFLSKGEHAVLGEEMLLLIKCIYLLNKAQ